MTIPVPSTGGDKSAHDLMDDYPIVVRALASHGLKGTRLAIPEDPLDDRGWGLLSSAIKNNRLWLVAADAVLSGTWPATLDQAERLFDGEEAMVAQMLMVERATLEVAALLDSLGPHGIDFRVLKGPAHAQILWGRPELRAWGDLDILVPDSRVGVVADALVGELGARWHDPEPIRDSVIRFAKSLTFTLPSGVEVDLHRKVVRGPFGEAVRADDLWARAREISVANGTMNAMSAEAMLIQSCFHALSRDPFQLVRLRDIAEGCRQDSTIDSDRLIALARRWDCEAVVASGVSRAVDLLGLEPGSDLTRWAESHSGSAKQRRWMGYYVDGPPTDRMMLALSTVRASRSWSYRIAYLRSLLFHPGRDPITVRIRRLLGR